MSDKDRLFDTNEQLYEHLENQHGVPVMREGETKEQAIARCEKKGIVRDKAKCKCKDCVEERERARGKNEGSKKGRRW